MPDSDKKPTTRRELEEQIVEKAWRDPDYKRRLLDNPRAVLQEELTSVDPALVLPEGVQVQIHEERAGMFHLVLPISPEEVARMIGRDRVEFTSQDDPPGWGINFNAVANANWLVNANVNANANANWNANYNSGFSAPQGEDE